MCAAALASSCAAPGTDDYTTLDDELVGGRVAAPGEFPSALYYWGRDFACSGVAVAPDRILTAAHCVDSAVGAIWVSNAVSTSYSTFTQDGAVLRNVLAYHVHPSWVAQCNNSTTSCASAPDVALIQLAEALPATITPAVVDARRLLPDERVVVMGYGCEQGVGLPETPAEQDSLPLKLAHSRVAYDSDLQRAEPGQADFTGAYALVVNRTIDAGSGTLCSGDSGGPLFLDDGQRTRVVGVNAAVASYNLESRLDAQSPHSVPQWLAALGVPIAWPGRAEILGAPIAFDADYYAVANPDLAGAGIHGHAALRAHWVTAGAFEGRIAHPVFRVREYLEANADLRAAYAGAPLADVVEHYARSGFAERRTPSWVFDPAVFDAAFYAAANPDLVAVGLRDESTLRRHWASWGVREGRRAGTFDVRAYRQYNPDLQAAFGDDWSAYVLHYVRSGRSEGRRSSH